MIDVHKAMLYHADMAMKDRLKEARVRASLTQVQFGKRLGVTGQAVSQWERGETVPEGKLHLPIARTLKCSLEDIFGDQAGNRHVPSEEVAAQIGRHDNDEFEINGIAEIDVRAGLGGGGLVDQVLVHDGEFSDPVKAETWSFPPTFVRNELQAPTNRLRVIETRGDSMTPTILPGERVIIDTGHTLPSPDGIYALRDQFGLIVVKRLQVTRNGSVPGLMIISDNPSHRPEEVGADEVAIVGRVVCALKMF